MGRCLLFLACCFVSAVGLPGNVFEFEQPDAEGQHWALLVAGSNGYFNYRHQVSVIGNCSTLPG